MDMADIKVLVLVGSLRAASVNRQLAEVATEVAPVDVQVLVFDGLGDVPFYNEDIDSASDAPEAARKLRAAAAEADAALVVTPEYNGSIPAVLKNAIDWLSRPFGHGALKDKPVAVIGTAGGRFGGIWAQDETRKSIGIAGTNVIDSIKLAIPLSVFGGRHPRENADVVESVREALGKLVAEVG
jgi:NAD(P)H-dependent FMN reductase